MGKRPHLCLLHTTRKRAKARRKPSDWLLSSPILLFSMEQRPADMDLTPLPSHHGSRRACLATSVDDKVCCPCSKAFLQASPQPSEKLLTWFASLTGLSSCCES